LPELIRQLKARGYKVVHMVPRQLLTTIPKYDEMVTQQRKLLSNNMRPETNVIPPMGARVLEPWSFEPPSSAGTSKSSSPGSGVPADEVPPTPWSEGHVLVALG